MIEIGKVEAQGHKITNSIKLTWYEPNYFESKVKMPLLKVETK